MLIMVIFIQYVSWNLVDGKLLTFVDFAISTEIEAPFAIILFLRKQEDFERAFT